MEITRHESREIAHDAICSVGSLQTVALAEAQLLEYRRDMLRSMVESTRIGQDRSQAVKEVEQVCATVDALDRLIADNIFDDAFKVRYLVKGQGPKVNTEVVADLWLEGHEMIRTLHINRRHALQEIRSNPDLFYEFPKLQVSRRTGGFLDRSHSEEMLFGCVTELYEIMHQ